MNTRSDRRSRANRRSRTEPAEPLGRKGTDRRQEDRRTTARVVRKVTLVELPQGTSQQVRASLGLEGAHFVAPSPLQSSELELRLHLPDLAEDARLRAKVLRTEPASGGTTVHVQFTGMDVKTELALARLLDFASRLQASREE